MSEDDLPRVSGIEPGGDLVAGGFEGLGGEGARQVLGPVHVGCAMAVVVAQGVEQGLRFLRGGGAVQVGLVLALQGGDGGEVGTPGGGLEHVRGAWNEKSGLTLRPAPILSLRT